MIYFLILSTAYTPKINVYMINLSYFFVHKRNNTLICKYINKYIIYANFCRFFQVFAFIFFLMFLYEVIHNGSIIIMANIVSIEIIEKADDIFTLSIVLKNCMQYGIVCAKKKYIPILITLPLRT